MYEEKESKGNLNFLFFVIVIVLIFVCAPNKIGSEAGWQSIFLLRKYLLSHNFLLCLQLFNPGTGPNYHTGFVEPTFTQMELHIFAKSHHGGEVRGALFSCPAVIIMFIRVMPCYTHLYVYLIRAEVAVIMICAHRVQ